MSKLEELLEDYCPDGVEYKKIRDCYQRLRGTPITAAKMKEIQNADGDIKIFAGGKTVINAFEKDIPKANVIRVPSVLVQSRGIIDAVYYDQPFTFKNEMWAYTSDNPLEVKFLYYVLKNNVEYFRSAASGMGSLPQISLKVTEEFEVPVPPLPVQEKIVRILDMFTGLTAELTAELTARKKQYEYYQDLLLNFSDLERIFIQQESQSVSKSNRIKFFQNTFGYAVCPLNEVILSLNTGLNPRRFFRLNTDDATNYYITIREILDGRIQPNEKTDRINDEALKLCNHRSNLEKGDVLFSGTGTIGEVAVVKEKPKNWNIKEGVYAIKPKSDVINSEFLAYILRTGPIRTAFMKKAAGGTVKSVPMGELRKLLIPIPPMEEQLRLVSILNQFHTLCSDISTGLPAEIEAREKQYEYYRDKLLTFKRKA